MSNKPNTVDMHIHTIYSDGTKTPNEVLKEAEEILGLKVIAITDHESVEALLNMDRSLFSGKIIPGVELTCVCRKTVIELLGYGFSPEKMKEKLPKLYQSKEEFQRGYLKACVSVFRANGIVFPEDILERYTDLTKQPSVHIWEMLSACDEETTKRNFECIQSDSVEHIIENGHIKGFYRVCLANPQSKFYVNYQGNPDFREVIKLIKDCGGMVFIPHIFQYGKDASPQILEELLGTGQINGIECYYPTFTDKQTQYLLNKCSTHGLFVSGGSDYHGDRKSNRLGRGIDGNLHVTEEKVDIWATGVTLEKVKERETEGRRELTGR